MPTCQPRKAGRNTAWFLGARYRVDAYNVCGEKGVLKCLPLCAAVTGLRFGLAANVTFLTDIFTISDRTTHFLNEGYLAKIIDLTYVHMSFVTNIGFKPDLVFSNF